MMQLVREGAAQAVLSPFLLVATPNHSNQVKANDMHLSGHALRCYAPIVPTHTSSKSLNLPGILLDH